MNYLDAYLSRWPAKSDTRRTMRGALDAVARALGGTSATDYPFHELRYAAARSVAGRLADAGLRPASVNKCLVALRGVLEAAWRSGQIPDDDYGKIEVESVPRGGREHAGRALSPDEAAALREAMPRLSASDAAMVAVLRACGLRRVEVVRLRREDYDGKAVRACGKGDKPRSVPVGKEWRRWVDAHWRSLEPDSFAFQMRDGRGATRRIVALVVSRARRAAGITASLTPHDLRRTFATDLLDAGVDIKTVKDLMGHSSIDTTTIYDRRGQERLFAAVEKIK